MFLGTTEDFWCASLNYSCIKDGQAPKKDFQYDENLSVFVWFENTGKTSGNEMVKTNVACQGDYEFVWFDAGHKESKERIETTSESSLEDGQTQQLERILETNPNLIK